MCSLWLFVCGLRRSDGLVVYIEHGVVITRTTSLGKSTTNVRLNQAFDLTSVMFVRFFVLFCLFFSAVVVDVAGVFSRARLRILYMYGVAVSTWYEHTHTHDENTRREIAFCVCVYFTAKTKITFMYSGISANLTENCNFQCVGLVGFSVLYIYCMWTMMLAMLAMLAMMKKRGISYLATNGIDSKKDSEITICQHAACPMRSTTEHERGEMNREIKWIDERNPTNVKKFFAKNGCEWSKKKNWNETYTTTSAHKLTTHIRRSHITYIYDAVIDF